MSYYFHKTPNWMQWIYPSLTWKIEPTNKDIYLTFDDGPIPEVTSYVLKQLDFFHAKATFFCVGDNIRKYPKQFNEVVESGHSIGNHTFNHVIGWNEADDYYVENIEKCQYEIEKHMGSQNDRLFRPPHGRIKKNQIRLIENSYEIVMWTYLTGDFDQNLTADKCLFKATKETSNGDIVIFHDSLKSFEILKSTLPKYLEYFTRQEFNRKNSSGLCPGVVHF